MSVRDREDAAAAAVRANSTWTIVFLRHCVKPLIDRIMLLESARSKIDLSAIDP